MSYQEKRSSLAGVLNIPRTVALKSVKHKQVAELKLWEMPHIQHLSGHTPKSPPPPHMVPFYTLRLYEIDYTGGYTVEGKECSVTGNTWLLVSAGMLQDPNETVLLTHCTGSTKGVEGYVSVEELKTPVREFKGNMRAVCVIVHAYYLQIPIHIIPKSGPGVVERFSNARIQDPIGRRWTSCHAASLAAAEALRQMKVPLSKDKRFVSGLSRGGFRALLLSAFDESVTHTFSVPGQGTFRNFVGPKGERYDGVYGRDDLLKKGIDIQDIFSLIKARTVVAFSMTDECIRPRHHWTLMEINRMRKALGLDPIRLKLYHEEPASFWGNELAYGHVLPRVESIEFFANAMFE